jgi:hypothetical protein
VAAQRQRADARFPGDPRAWQWFFIPAGGRGWTVVNGSFLNGAAGG